MSANLGITLRDLRVAEGLTQAQVAQELGVHRVTVAKWETGRLGFSGTARKLIELWLEGRE